tara:strand:+ start:185 stop:451 length:267 start_codon:yes stop_codon:yes gene_type:complete
MEVWITVAGLFIGGEGETFYINWNSVESFGMNDENMKLQFILSSGQMVHWKTYDTEFYDKVKETIYAEVPITVMFNRKQAEVEVNCGK